MLAEFPDHSRVGVIGDAVQLIQLGAERVDDLLLLGHVVGAAAVGDRLDNRFAESRCPGVGGVHVPFVLLRPTARLQQDRETR
jgi:hypothetical protein